VNAEDKTLQQLITTLIDRLRLERAKLQERTLAVRTVTGYGYDWRMFEAWCSTTSRAALPASPDTISLYLTDLLSQGKKVTTARRRASAVAHHHRKNGLPFPGKEEIRDLLNCAARIRAEMPRQMRALDVGDLRAMAGAYLADKSPRALRNRSIVTLGFASALRRSSLTHLEMRDIEFTPEGLIVTVRHEKWNRDGKPRQLGVPRGACKSSCPVASLEDWLAWRGRDGGPLFTHVTRPKGRRLREATIHLIVREGLTLIGRDPGDYGSHSLRAGFVTAAGEAGASELLIAAQTGHRSMWSLRGYFRRTDLFRANACAMIGL
jgi:integrase